MKGALFTAALATAATALAASQAPGPVQVSPVPAPDGKVLPWGGAIPEVKSEPYKGPYRATLGCAEGLKNFPFLKPWVAKLDDFAAPVEIGSTEGSLFYAIGATTASRESAEPWLKDSYRAPVDWKSGGTIESVWLGEAQTTAPAVRPGPGYAAVKAGSGDAESWSQMTSRRDNAIDPKEPALQHYASLAISPNLAKSVDKPWDRFWALLFSAAELDLLSKCSKEDCKIKFSDTELQGVTGASHQYRLAQYRQAINKRVEEYRKLGRVWAYEGTYKPMDWEDLPVSPQFPAKYQTHFWEPSNRSSFGYDVLDAEPGHQKPVVGLYSRQCERRGTGPSGYTACTDIVVYNNHYFDFWSRLVYFFPWCGVEVVLAYETMDIDQIKESRIVRILFGGEIRKLMGLLLETRLKHLHMLGF